MKYGRSVIAAFSFDEAVGAAKTLLEEEGFGVLCDIDVGKTLAEKTGVPFRGYRILGACNPHFAREALEAEPHVGLLLPCNLVNQKQSGETIVSAVNALALLSLVENPNLAVIADEVNESLGRVLDGLARGTAQM
ncbi:MAG: DUF302 domain-containing protein [Candidatus Eremiobacteraeota bacterium]|nr:DUF302 domain-containing protein [Candidatus Eremiobacteraeota bacterium]